MKQDYKIYNWYNNKNTDGLVNRFARNMVIINQAHRVAWLIGQYPQVRYCVFVTIPSSSLLSIRYNSLKFVIVSSLQYPQVRDCVFVTIPSSSLLCIRYNSLKFVIVSSLQYPQVHHERSAIILFFHFNSISSLVLFVKLR